MFLHPRQESSLLFSRLHLYTHELSAHQARRVWKKKKAETSWTASSHWFVFNYLAAGCELTEDRGREEEGSYGPNSQECKQRGFDQFQPDVFSAPNFNPYSIVEMLVCEGGWLLQRPASRLLWTAACALLSGPVVTRRGADGEQDSWIRHRCWC